MPQDVRVFVHSGGQQGGPFTLAEVNAKALDDEVDASTPAWIEDWTEWRTLSSVPGFVPKPFVPKLSPPPFRPPQEQVPSPPPFRPVPEQIPPNNALAPTEAEMPQQNAKSLFLYIPIRRLVGMSILTFGFYQSYWIYRNWRFLKERDKLNIKPFWRGIFGYFFIYPLLKAIRNETPTLKPDAATFWPGALATGWIVLQAFSLILSWNPGSTATVFGVLAEGLAILLLIPVQSHINGLNESLQPPPAHYGWSLGHIVLLILGILLWICSIAGLTQTTTSN